MRVTFKDPKQLRNNILAALEAAGVDPARPTNQVLLEIRPGVARVVATDGHWLWLNELACEADGEGSLRVLTTHVERFAKYLQKCSSRIIVDAGAREVWDGDPGERQPGFNLGTPHANEFPPYRDILPAPDEFGGERIVPCVDGQLLARVCRAFTLAAGSPSGMDARRKANQHAVPLFFHTQPHTKHKAQDPIANPIAVTCSDRITCARALAVVMPFNSRWMAQDLGQLREYRGRP